MLSRICICYWMCEVRRKKWRSVIIKKWLELFTTSFEYSDTDEILKAIYCVSEEMDLDCKKWSYLFTAILYKQEAEYYEQYKTVTEWRYVDFISLETIWNECEWSKNSCWRHY
jgi:hypothetical protein